MRALSMPFILRNGRLKSEGRAQRGLRGVEQWDGGLAEFVPSIRCLLTHNSEMRRGDQGFTQAA